MSLIVTCILAAELNYRFTKMDMFFYLGDVRGAILNPGEQISKAGAEFMPPGVQY